MNGSGWFGSSSLLGPTKVARMLWILVVATTLVPHEISGFGVSTSTLGEVRMPFPTGALWGTAPNTPIDEWQSPSETTTTREPIREEPVTGLSYDPSKFKAGALIRKTILHNHLHSTPPRQWNPPNHENDASNSTTTASSSPPPAIVLIDVENVRGKSGFALSHAELVHGLSIWTRICQLQGQVSLIVDHGNVEAAYYIPTSQLAIVFAGPRCKADDVIAHDVHDFLATSSTAIRTNVVVVVTADRGLIDRCRRRTGLRKTVTIVQPLTLLEDLEHILQAVPMPKQSDDTTLTHDGTTSVDPASSSSFLEPEIKALDHEIKLGAELLEAEAMLRTKGGINHKRKGKLKAKVRSLREKLLKSSSPLLNQVVADVLKQGPQQAFGTSGSNHHLQSPTEYSVSQPAAPRLSPEQQTALLARWEKLRKSMSRKEKTGDRVILAEQWRRQLEEQVAARPPTAWINATDLSNHNLNVTNNSTAVSETNTTMTTTATTTRMSANMAMAHVFRYNANHYTPRPGAYGQTSWIQNSVPLSSSSSPFVVNDMISMSAAAADYVLPNSTSLRLVVISDTHGFEKTLANEEDGTSLPDGDVLLHLGDFAMDGSHKKSSAVRFDQWLAQQPHAHKIIVRGNHDPRTWFPETSGATFVTTPKTVTIGDFVFALVPHLSGGKLSNRLMPKRCHVLASHLPPKDILDHCYSGKNAGSSGLRKGVERMVSKTTAPPPSLWLCGHIHESRGAIRHAFGSSTTSPSNNQNDGADSEETLVLNAANANSGIAKRLEHGPVVLQLSMVGNKGRQSKCHVEIVSMDNQFEYLNQKDPNFFEKAAASTTTTTADEYYGPEDYPLIELLLAVDLGLRTGFALYNDEGQLLTYENVEFGSPQELEEGALHRIREWEAQFKPLPNEKDAKPTARISHIAIEGADVELRQVWREICSQSDSDDNTDHAAAPRQLLLVRPEEWRADLLSSKEKRSGQKSKEAARLIARQVVADFGVCGIHQGKFPTDVAEAVCLGYHVSRRLGWIVPHREPAVRRFTNGNIIVPTTSATPLTVTNATSVVPIVVPANATSTLYSDNPLTPGQMQNTTKSTVLV